jgi:hypothetical protein
VNAFGWYKKMHDEIMNDPERKARYEECMAELIDEEKMITNLKRLLFEAVPYIRADADYALTEECNDHERANESRRLLNEIEETLKEDKR